MEKQLWGRKKGAPEYAEELLCTQPERFEEVKKIAAKDGFGHFRIGTFDWEKPDFTKALGKGR